ncbi:NUDIX domain-containing protein [Quadrisphaera sp. DSM 44207]|uniref:NUDIX hydrolase n=1 Tax=Quadrisphaera sp. DSM 44207 TaxID=1881057 RepID=UPI00088FE65D|nr:NUDIX domain-containing protein [Quadrisphaera sp. DSM 44207]SDQ36471.1 ADP-ribose pyrophosphatase YjhB, NUDIX family [Quadrisphaera sp. DSM 44207]
MPVPEFIASLRARIGHDLLWLPGVTAVVRDAAGRVLLTRRSDTGAWALPSGIPEPGEQMARACAREVLEETGVGVVVERLVGVQTLPPTAYPDGDRCQFVDHSFACRAVAGRAHVADDESTEVVWCAEADLPDLGWQTDVVRRAADPHAPAWFAT